jgi:hypothetical protein
MTQGTPPVSLLFSKAGEVRSDEGPNEYRGRCAFALMGEHRTPIKAKKDTTTQRFFGGGRMNQFSSATRSPVADVAYGASDQPSLWIPGLTAFRS